VAFLFHIDRGSYDAVALDGLNIAEHGMRRDAPINWWI
jgi:hypothetical protein